MDSRSLSYSIKEEESNVYSTATETSATTTAESFSTSGHGTINVTQESVFSPLATPFQSRMGNEYLQQQEVRSTEAGISNNIEEAFFDFRLNRTDSLFDDSENNAQNYLRNNNNTNAVPSGHNSVWTDGFNAGNGEMLTTYDFLLKSLASANNYVSMLTPEQLSVLRSIRPGLLYEFLQEVANACSNKRTRRPLPNECAFCKNNGENEECFSSHALKDWRGRVLCPVLRAFRCPRCGATGDRAHTIKYCPEVSVPGLERSGGFMSRRRISSSTSLFSNGTGCMSGSNTATPTPSSSLTNLNSSIWSNFNIN